MSEPHDCPAMRSLLAELATGAAAGHERAWALGHVAGCPACSTELAELTKVADGLLMLAPPAEPPPEFESAVLARLGMAAEPAEPAERRRGVAAEPDRRRSGVLRRLSVGRRRPAHGRPAPGPDAGPRTEGPDRRHRRRVIGAVAGLVAAVLVAAGGGAAIVYRQGEQDRVVADQYRRTLAVADGRYLRAARLLTAAGEHSGTVFLYQGNPSWLLVTVSGAPADGRYEVRVVDRSGAISTAGSCQVENGSGAAGYRLDVRVARVAEVQLRQDGRVQLTATVAR